jgi:hypothetical protein
VSVTIESLSDLETRGFVVARGFLDPAELAMLRDDFAGVAVGANRNYRSKAPTAGVLAALRPRIDDVLAQVNSQTTLHVDAHVPNNSAYFGTDAAEGTSFPWHQDHESYFVVQNHFDYLNFYVPFVKPDPHKSNLSVIPFDVLQQHSRRASRFLERGGAGSFRHVRHHWVATNDDSGRSKVISADLDGLAVTPELEEGDLLLLRGDIVHRTQDTDTDRVALSWRTADGATIVKRSRLASGSLRKAVMMRNNALPYQKMFQAFDAAAKDELPLRELLAAYESMPTPDPMSSDVFFKYLMREKRRAHVMGRFVAHMPIEAGFKGLDRLQRAMHR